MAGAQQAELWSFKRKKVPIVKELELQYPRKVGFQGGGEGGGMFMATIKYALGCSRVGREHIF